MSVLVYNENWDGKFKKQSFELLSYAGKVAEMLGSEVVALSIGDVAEDELKKLGNYSAKKIISVNNDKLKDLDNQAYTQVIAEVAEKVGAKVVLLSHNNTGKALAPRLSVRLKAGLGAAVTQLPKSTEPFTVNKKVFSGKAYANVVIKSDIKILTLAQNSFELIENPADAAIENFDATVGDVKTQVVEADKQTGKLILTDAEIVVSGGRGLKSADNWNAIEDLAETLGAATACSRPVSDEGWRPHGEHTGQTGKIIAPNLYIAAGISGAIQHLAGVSGSKCLVAINTDKDAPVFESADYGIIGDALKVLPKLNEAIKEAKSK